MPNHFHKLWNLLPSHSSRVHNDLTRSNIWLSSFGLSLTRFIELYYALSTVLETGTTEINIISILFLSNYHSACICPCPPSTLGLSVIPKSLRMSESTFCMEVLPCPDRSAFECLLPVTGLPVTSLQLYLQYLLDLHSYLKQIKNWKKYMKQWISRMDLRKQRTINSERKETNQGSP